MSNNLMWPEIGANQNEIHIVANDAFQTFDQSMTVQLEIEIDDSNEYDLAVEEYVWNGKLVFIPADTPPDGDILIKTPDRDRGSFAVRNGTAQDLYIKTSSDPGPGIKLEPAEEAMFWGAAEGLSYYSAIISDGGGGTITVADSGTDVGSADKLDFYAAQGFLFDIQQDGTTTKITGSLDIPYLRGMEHLWVIPISGSSTAYSAQMNPELLSYDLNMVILFKPDVNNGLNPTLEIDENPAVPILLGDGSGPVGVGDLNADNAYLLWYDGTGFRVMSGGSSGGGEGGTVLSTKALILPDPGDAEDIALWYTSSEIQILKLSSVLVGTSSQSVSWKIEYGPDRASTPDAIITAGTTTTNTDTGSHQTSFDNSVIPANNWLVFKTTAKAGTVSQLNLTIQYVEVGGGGGGGGGPVSFASLTGDPYDNDALSDALNAKLETVTPSDIGPGIPDSGKMLTGDGWVDLPTPPDFPTELSELDDTTIVTPTDGDLLRFSSGKWRNYAPKPNYTAPDLFANRPAANTVAPGTLFAATDISYKYWISDGTNWIAHFMGHQVVEPASAGSWTAFGNGSWALTDEGGYLRCKSTMGSTVKRNFFVVPLPVGTGWTIEVELLVYQGSGNIPAHAGLAVVNSTDPVTDAATFGYRAVCAYHGNQSRQYGINVFSGTDLTSAASTLQGFMGDLSAVTTTNSHRFRIRRPTGNYIFEATVNGYSWDMTYSWNGTSGAGANPTHIGIYTSHAAAAGYELNEINVVSWRQY